MAKGIRGSTATCEVEDCTRKVKAYGWCEMHACRERKANPEAYAARREARRPHVGICLAENCTRRTVANGWCGLHDRRMKDWGQLDPPDRSRPCIIGGCDQRAYGRGWCKDYWASWDYYGDPLERDRRRRPDGTVRRVLKSHCKRGHELSGDNVRLYTHPRSGQLVRTCIKCTDSYAAWYRTTRRAEADDIAPIDVLNRDGWICQLCGGVIPRDVGRTHSLFGQADHVVAVSNGGKHTWDNVQAAHRHCNISKGNREFPTTLPPGVETSQLVLPLWRPLYR